MPQTHLENVTLHEVTSSHVEAIGHDEDTNTLVVLFKGGTRFAYQPVTQEAFRSLYNADSVGRFLNENIKSNPGITATRI